MSLCGLRYEPMAEAQSYENFQVVSISQQMVAPLLCLLRVLIRTVGSQMTLFRYPRIERVNLRQE